MAYSKVSDFGILSGSAEAVNSISGDLDTTFGNFTVPEGASTFGGSDYFSNLKTYAGELASKGKNNAGVVNEYMAVLEELEGITPSSQVDSKALDGNGGGGGVGPANYGGYNSFSPKTGISTGNSISDDNLTRMTNARNHADLLEQSNTMSNESYASTVAFLDHVEDLNTSHSISDNTLTKAINATEHAMDLLESKRMSDQSYWHTINTLEHGASLRESKRITDSTLARTFDTVDHAMNLLESNKITEAVYNKIITSIDHAETLIEKGLITESQYNKSLDLINDTIQHTADGTINESECEDLFDAMDSIMDNVEDGKIENYDYSKTVSVLDGNLDLLKEGKIDNETLDNTVSTINQVSNSLKNDLIDAGTYNQTITGFNYAFTSLQNGNIRQETYNNAIAAFKLAYSEFSAGNITEAEYNQRIKNIISCISKDNVPYGYAGEEIKTNPSPQPEPGPQPTSNPNPQPTVEPVPQPTANPVPEPTPDPTAKPIGDDIINKITEEDGNTVSGNSMTSSLKSILEERNLADIIENGKSKYAHGVIPTIVHAATSSTNATVGAATAVLAGSVAATAGYTLNRKNSTIKFTPDDWFALDTNYQDIITKLMKKVGFSKENIEKFTTSNFRVPSSLLNNRKSIINNELNENFAFEEAIVDKYGYTIFDDKGNINNYLLFVTMIIDGINIVDEYNLFNLMENYDPDSDDELYNGIHMDAYIDEDDDGEENIDSLESFEYDNSDFDDEDEVATSSDLVFTNKEVLEEF